MNSVAPKGYNRVQIALHWVIAILVIAAFVTHDTLIAAVKAINAGTWTGYDAATLIHMASGTAVFFLAIWRLRVLARRGAPPLPEDESAVLRATSIMVKVLLYVIMFLMPITGVLYWFGDVAWARQIHVLMDPVVPLIILLHLLGALYQQFWLKSDVLTRMIRPEIEG